MPILLLSARKSHTKSRRGCSNCKNRHTKCDEQGPPCANCVARGATATCDLEARSRLWPPDHDSTSTSSMDSKVPSPFNSENEARRMLEVELMHQWSTSTHKTLSDPTKDNGLFQSQLPRWALQYDFLLHGIMALSALEIAFSEEAREGRDSAYYGRVGLEYYDNAVSTFREQLPKLTDQNAHLAYLFSSIISVTNIAIPQCVAGPGADPEQTVKDHLGQFMTLISGSSNIFAANEEVIRSGPISMPVNDTISSVFDSVSGSLSEDYERAFTRLAVVVESIDLYESNETGFVPDPPKVNLSMYQKAVTVLRLCCIESFKPDNQIFSLAFPSMVVPAFISAYNKSDIITLYITLHWAVLLHRLDVEYWWAKGIGRHLGKELSEILSRTELPTGSGIEEQWKQGIQWARKHAGLPLEAD